MKPSELALELDRVDRKLAGGEHGGALATLQALVIDDLPTILLALRHHAALVETLANLREAALEALGEDDAAMDDARELLATIEREVG